MDSSDVHTFNGEEYGEFIQHDIDDYEAQSNKGSMFDPDSCKMIISAND